MYKALVVPLDGSAVAENVLPYVNHLAEGYEVQVELVRAIPPVPDLPAALSRSDTPHILRNAIKTRAQDYLENVAENLRTQGLAVSTLVMEGDVASAIVDTGESESGKLILMGTHGWSGKDRWNLGSVTLKVLQSNSSLVMVVPGSEDDESSPVSDLSTVFVPLDGSTLSETALPHATYLAERLKLRLALVRVAPTSWEYFPNLDHTVLHMGDISRDIVERAESYLDGVAQRLKAHGTGDCEYRVLRGHPADEIIKLADQTPGSIVLMASHGQGSSETYRWSIGSVAQRVAGDCSRPTLVVGRS